MQASRLLSILMLLQSRGRLPASQLALQLEVSVRTILRDVDELSAAGVPVWAERGRHGGIQLREGWSTQLTGMTDAEAQALLLAGLPGPATQLGLGAAAASARLKMVASLPAALREQADRVSQCLHIDPLDWYRAPDTPHFLQEVAAAVWRTRCLRVTYESWRGTVQRELEPLGLVLKAGAWYVLARQPSKPGVTQSTGHEVRTYRLASMRSLVAGERTFKRPRGFDLARAWQDSAARFEKDLRKLQARVRVSPRGMAWLAHARIPVVAVPAADEPDKPRATRSKKGHSTSVSQASRAGAAGWLDVLMPLESIEQGARQLLAYGGEVEALAPAELRAQVQALAAALARQHR